MFRVVKYILSVIVVVILFCGTEEVVAAQWSDAADIENRYDAQFLNNLQIMQGFNDGTFRPDGYLTRAQAAKMVYVAANRGMDDGAHIFVGLVDVFHDVPGHWAEGYINYAYGRGFVVGKGQGKFAPNAYVTGYEAMKMVLTALGYDAYTEKFIGLHWQYNVVATAVESGVLEGYIGNPNLPINRDDASKIFANFINTSTVKYTSGYPRPDAKTFGQTYMNLVRTDGIVVANEFTGGDSGTTTLEGGDTYAVSTGFAELGQMVSIYTKGEGTDHIYGVAILTPDNTVIETHAHLPDAESLKQHLHKGGLVETSSTDLSGIKTITFTARNPVAYGDEGIVGNGRGEYLRAIDNNGDMVADYFVRIIKEPDIVDGMSAVVDTVTFRKLGYIRDASKKVVFTDGFPETEQQVLLYQAGGVYYVNQSKSVTGKLAASVAGTYATIAGRTNVYGSALAYDPIDSGGTAGNTFEKWIVNPGNFNRQMTFYLDDVGNVIRIAPLPDTTHYRYAYVIDATTYVGNTWTKSFAYLKIIDESGDVTIADIKSYNGFLVEQNLGKSLPVSAITGLNGTPALDDGTIIRYTVSPDGKYNIFTGVEQAPVNGTITAGRAEVGQGLYGIDSTVFILYDSLTDKTRVYVGKVNLPTLTSAEGDIFHTGMIANVVFVTSSSITGTTEPAYVYITDSDPVMTVDSESGKVYYTYSVIIDDVETDLKSDTTTYDRDNNPTSAEVPLEVGLYSYVISLDTGGYTFTWIRSELNPLPDS